MQLRQGCGLFLGDKANWDIGADGAEVSPKKGGQGGWGYSDIEDLCFDLGAGKGRIPHFINEVRGVPTTQLFAKEKIKPDRTRTRTS